MGLKCPVQFFFARAPRDGLAAVEGWQRVPPLALFGLTEAPRLWYLRARQILIGVGFVELGIVKATFIYRAITGELVAMLVLHVDD